MMVIDFLFGIFYYLSHAKQVLANIERRKNHGEEESYAESDEESVWSVIQNLSVQSLHALRSLKPSRAKS